MGQLIRGLLWRRLSGLALAALTAVVVAGCLVSVRYSQLTDTPVGSIGVLIVLGAVATSAHAAATARERRTEIALAQIRGRHGVGLFVSFLAEPLALIAVGTAVGILVGRLVLSYVVTSWLDGGSSDASISAGAWVAVGAAVACAVGSVIGGSWRIVREPLIEQLDDSHRPQPAASMVLLGQTALVVAAGIAIYQSAKSTGARDGWAAIADPALLTPVLLGLAAGQSAVWLVRGVGIAMTRGGRGGGGLASFLAVRRLARRSDTAFGARLVIAAGVVAAVTTNAAAAADAWQGESTKIALGGDRQFTVEDGALAAYEATHRVDPDGKYLMAMVADPDNSDAYRRVFVDTERWDAVVGDFYAGTGASGVGGDVADLQRGTAVETVTADTVTATFDAASLADSNAVALSVYYLSPSGSVRTAILKPPRNQTTGTVEASSPVRGCAVGCVVTQLIVDGNRYHSDLDVVIPSIAFGSTELLDGQWAIPAGDGRYGSGSQTDAGLEIGLNRFGDSINFAPPASSQPLAAVHTPGLKPNRSQGSEITYAVDGSDREVRWVGTAATLPVVGRVGVLVDLPTAIAATAGQAVAATSYIVARDDTPASMIAQLKATGLVGHELEYATALTAAKAKPSAQGIRLYTLMSAFAALIALLGLAASAGSQRRDRRHEAASLRVTGVPTRTLAAAIRTEAVWLAATAFVLVAAAGWIASRVAVRNLHLVAISKYTPLVGNAPSLATTVAASVGAALVIGVGTFVAYRSVARTSPPGILRGDAS